MSTYLHSNLLVPVDSASYTLEILLAPALLDISFFETKDTTNSIDIMYYIISRLL